MVRYCILMVCGNAMCVSTCKVEFVLQELYFLILLLVICLHTNTLVDKGTVLLKVQQIGAVLPCTSGNCKEGENKTL